jgi:hypothetical protein
MSDIIYTPPASSGGTTINPTNNFIPVRSNATTFIDSCLNQISTTNLISKFGSAFKGIDINSGSNFYKFGDFNLTLNGTTLIVNDANEFICTINGNEIKGINLDFNNFNYQFGDFQNYFNGTSFVVNDATQTIYTLNNGVNNGFNLDFNLNFYKFGDINGNELQIDGANKYILFVLGGIQFGIIDGLNSFIEFGNAASLLKLDWANRTSVLGDYGGSLNRVYLQIDHNNDNIKFFENGSDNGLSVDFGAERYYLGDYNAFNNSTYLYIGDNSKLIEFNTVNGTIQQNADLLTFNGALTSGSSGGSSGQHLQVTINGTQYKIKLENP